jgi:starch synthase
VKILVLSSEAVPFAKVGGLADVAGSLPLALHDLGHDVRLAIPRYARIAPERFGLTTTIPDLQVPVDGSVQPARIMESRLSNKVPVYLVDSAPYFGREGIYGYQDDGERFIFFCRAALEMLRRLDWQPDVVHCHDWHTGIVPNWLKTIYKGDPFFANTASLFTIHSLQYQGIFGFRVLQVAGLAEGGFIVHPQIADLNQVVDLLARGIIFADAVNTVSERYAQEIMTSEFGEKLDPILRERRESVFGILNGIDQDIFNPATDTALTARFDLHSLARRAENKAALQRHARLPLAPNVPVIGMISRLADQKGIDLLADLLDHVLDLNVQFVLMGTGDQHYHDVFTNFAQTYPQQASVFLTFDHTLAQTIYAGSDMYLMPSRVEPCGLGQMIAMRYGSVPVVHATGGLADTVHDWNPATGEGNGFAFGKYDRWPLFVALVRAIETYRYQETWRKLQTTGMSGDYSWNRSAAKYVDVYQKALSLQQAR